MYLLLLSIAFSCILFYFGDCILFDHHPLNTTVKVKDAHSLTCIVEFQIIDTSQYKMRWKKDGVYIASNGFVREDLINISHFAVTLSRYSYKVVYTLTFNNVWNSDRGFYQCDVFEHSNLVLESNKAFLDVIQIPDERYPLCSVSKDVYTEGDDVMLFCVSEYTEPPITLLWNDGAIPVVEIVDGQTARLQKILIAKPDLNGYKAVCSLTNLQIPSLNRNCTTQPLTIYYKPRVTIAQSGIISVEKQALFICETSANPVVTRYTWSTFPAIEATEYKIDDSGHVFMLLNPTIQHHRMVITCTAENQLGSSSNNVQLTIQSNTQNHVTVESQTKYVTNRPTEHHKSGNFSNEASTGLSVDVIVIIIVASVVLLVIIVMIPVYYYCLCSRNSHTTQTTTIVHQPEVYFEPRDRMTLPLPRTRDAAIWRRSFAAQAPDDKEVDAMYLEIQSNHYFYATTSRCNTMR